MQHLGHWYAFKYTAYIIAQTFPIYSNIHFLPLVHFIHSLRSDSIHSLLRAPVGLCAKSLQSCLTLCNPMDCSPPGSSAHGILQARILEWVAVSSSRRSSRPRDQTHTSCISCIGRRVLYYQHHLGSPHTVFTLFVFQLRRSDSQLEHVGDLVPQPGIELGSPCIERAESQSLEHQGSPLPHALFLAFSNSVQLLYWSVRERVWKGIISGRVASPLFVQLLKYSVMTKTVNENTVNNYFLFMMESVDATMAFSPPTQNEGQNEFLRQKRKDEICYKCFQLLMEDSWVYSLILVHGFKLLFKFFLEQYLNYLFFN